MRVYVYRGMCLWSCNAQHLYTNTRMYNDTLLRLDVCRVAVVCACLCLEGYVFVELQRAASIYKYMYVR